jgi:low temperature requirement protein LtrA
MAGKREAARRYLPALLRRFTPATLDQALRLVQPGRSFIALVSVLMTVLAALADSDWLLPWQVWAIATAVQVLEPIPFLARDGVSAGQLARYPLLVIMAALWIPVRLASSLVKGWYHTPHTGSSEG